jgi:hypothetical protein
MDVYKEVAETNYPQGAESPIISEILTKMNNNDFWDIKAYNSVDRYERFGRNCFLHLENGSVETLTMHVPPKRLYLSTKLHSSPSQRTVILFPRKSS